MYEIKLTQQQLLTLLDMGVWFRIQCLYETGINTFSHLGQPIVAYKGSCKLTRKEFKKIAFNAGILLPKD